MSIFGPRAERPLSIRTFRPSTAAPPMPPGPPMLVPPPSIVDRLLRAAMDAELAQMALSSAKERCAKGPTADNQRAVLMEAANALEKEMAFDELWEKASTAWFMAQA